MWAEFLFLNNKNVICVIFSRQHNSPEVFNHILVKKLKNLGRCIVTMGDFNIDPLKGTWSSYSINFLASKLFSNSCSRQSNTCPLYLRLLPSLITSSLINPDQVVASENITSDKSEHFTQLCVSMRDRTKIKKTQVRDFSRLSTLTLFFLIWNGMHSFLVNRMEWTIYYLPFIRQV